MSKTNYALVILVVILLGALGYGYLKYTELSKNFSQTKEEMAANITDLEGKNTYLTNELTLEQRKNSSFQEQITGIASTVGTLDRLSKTDKELLQKYSKVYFLNENYVPGELFDIPSEFVYDRNRSQKVHTKALPFLLELFKAAKDSGNSLQVISAYRSFDDQTSLKTSYKITYGSGANQFSADQGYSEHQLGTALDFTTPDLGNSFSDFRKSPAYTWLIQNAYKYGFVLSYPEGNSYYQFEPWHWRFVGKALAFTLHNENKNFYDLDQRAIDSYLINIFN